MTRTARRRWSREFQGEIDGIALGETGPVILHGYDPPAGGKWIDNVIPGKLGAYDRGTGEQRWVSPCEVGYGRGFGCGLGEEDDVVILGPSIKSHRIARMSLSTGELLGASEIRPFDQALVFGDVCLTVTPQRVTGILTSAMIEVWSHARDGERYHLVGRIGPHAYVVFTDTNRKRQGVLRLDLESGDFVDAFLDADLPVIHELVCADDQCVVLAGNRVPSRPGQASPPQELRLEAFRSGETGAIPLWREVLADESDELPDVSISLDSGKLYLARGAMLEVRDALSGRMLGELTLPGLDERVAFQVAQGAGLLAEETRASVFELPA
ncbi:MAG TPA: hypothetical protein VF530_09670 [Planctomycetota bacterium]